MDIVYTVHSFSAHLTLKELCSAHPHPAGIVYVCLCVYSDE